MVSGDAFAAEDAIEEIVVPSRQDLPVGGTLATDGTCTIDYKVSDSHFEGTDLLQESHDAVGENNHARRFRSARCGTGRPMPASTTPRGGLGAGGNGWPLAGNGLASPQKPPSIYPNSISRHKFSLSARAPQFWQYS
jgi:hypothetical protein